jgi:valyl-tRNA synthetase
MAALIESVHAVRNVRAEKRVDPAKRVEAFVEVENERLRSVLDGRGELIEALARVAPLHVGAPGLAPLSGTVRAVTEATTVVVPLAGMVDVGVERVRLEKELDGVRAQVERLRRQLSSDSFRSKAPDHVVRKMQDDLTSAEAKAVALSSSLATLG